MSFNLSELVHHCSIYFTCKSCWLIHFGRSTYSPLIHVHYGLLEMFHDSAPASDMEFQTKTCQEMICGQTYEHHISVSPQRWHLYLQNRPQRKKKKKSYSGGGELFLCTLSLILSLSLWTWLKENRIIITYHYQRRTEGRKERQYEPAAGMSPAYTRVRAAADQKGSLHAKRAHPLSTTWNWHAVNSGHR